MLHSWLILMAAMGQTTSPNTRTSMPAISVVTRDRVTAIPVADYHVAASQPASSGLRVIGQPLKLSPTSRPAAAPTPKRPAVAPAPKVVDRPIAAPKPSHVNIPTVVARPATMPARADMVSAPAKPVAPVIPPTTRPALPFDVSKLANRPPAAPASPATAGPSAADVSDFGTLSGEPVEVTSTSTGEIIINANEHDLKILSKLIGLLDYQSPDVEQTVRIFPLESAQATDVAANIQKLWNDFKKPIAGQVRPEDRLTIIPDPRANLLMVATAVGNLDQVEMMVKQLDQLPKNIMKFTPVQLTYIKAAEAEVLIKDMLKAKQQLQGASKELFTIQADIRTNTLLVSASEKDIEQIKQLVSVIDVEPSPASGGVVKVALIPLRKAVAADMVKALNDMLTSQGDAAKAMKEQIRRLQVVLTENGKQLPDVDLEKPIKLFAEPGTNSVIVATIESNIAPLTAIVSELDKMPLGDDVMLSLYPLEYADATSLRDDLQKIFDQSKTVADVPGKESVKGRTPEGVTSGLMAPISLVADKRTNTLIVSGRAEQLLLVQQIVKTVDVDKIANKFPIRMVKLVHSDVKRIKEVAQKLADQRAEIAKRLGDMAVEREKILLIEDVRTNSLIIVADDSNFQEVQDLAIKLDGADADWLGQIKIVNLPGTLTAPDISTKIEELWKRRAELRTQGGLPADKPVIVSDSRTNSLVVASNQEDFEAIQRLVDQLSQQKLNPMMDIYQVLVKNNDASKVAETVQKVCDQRLKNSMGPNDKEQPADRVFVIADPLTRTLLVVSSKNNYDEIVSLVNKLDVPPPVDGVIRTYYVKNIDVGKAVDMITKLFKDGLYRQTNEKDLPDSMKKVTIVSDVRSSAIIVSASPDNFAVIEKILAEIDRAETPIAQTFARFFELKHADAVATGDVLTKLLEGLSKSLPKDQSDQLTFTVIPTGRVNQLILVGTRYAMQRAEELVPKLDVPPGMNSAVTQIYQLKDASAVQLEKVLTKLFDEQAKTGGKGERTPITIYPDDKSNSLLVTASQDDHIKMQELVGLLDRKSMGAQQMKIIPLAEAKSDQIAKSLTDLMKEQGKDAQGFTVVSEPRTNSLLVWAAGDMMTQIQEIANRLDNSRPKEELSLRVFKLGNAKAEDLSKLLEDFFKNAGTGNGKEAKQMIISFPVDTNPQTGEAILQNLVHQDVTIMPDKATNSLLVMAPTGSIDMMRMLIEMLDRVEPQTVSLRVFELQNADAAEMQKLLEGLFKGQGKGEGTAPQITLGGEGAGALAAAAGAVGGGGTGGVLEVQFSVDERTNTLIAAGSPAHLRIVESLVLQLDYKEMDERIAKVVRLRYSKASDMAKTLTDYFKQESDLLEKALGKEAGQRQFRRQVIVTEANQGPITASESGGSGGGGKRESNMLLVSVSPQMESLVYRMINELDQPAPQVMIQMLMAEVTVDDSFDLGMEFAVQDLVFSEHATLNPNTGLPQGSGYDFVLGTDLGVAAGGGFSFTLTGEDFSFLLRALQGEGRTEILARPSIMVQDGQAAMISIGDQVPIVKSASVSQGVVIPAVDYVDATIKLSVTPIINPDGFVNMMIKPEIKNISASSQDLGNGIKAPIINTREAETSVTIKDGETIIIGGLIKGTKTDQETKVPVVGDIPLLGNLFRSTTKRSTKTELLIIITPHVMRAVEDSRKLSEKMRDETGIMDDSIRANPLMQGLQVKPSDAPVKELSPTQTQPSGKEAKDEPFGPELDEYGPSASSVRTGPVPAVVVKVAGGADGKE
jgi:type II secretion system protein D